MKKRPFEAPTGEGVIAWLYLADGYLAANVMAPSVKNQIGRLMIHETIGLLGEDPSDWGRLIATDAEAGVEKLRTLDAGINFIVGHNLLCWEERSGVREIERNLDILIGRNCTPYLEEFAAAFDPYPDHSPYGTLLGVKHLLVHRLILTKEFWWARKLHLKWTLKAFQLWSPMSSEHGDFHHRDLQLEIYLEQQMLVVREKNLAGDPPDQLASPNIIVLD